MGTPFMSEIKIVSFGFAPKGWALCNGALLPINQNQALFSLLGTTYGGDGRVDFALPDLRGRVPIHMGAGFIEGQTGGEALHTVTQSEMPAHNHLVNATSTPADTNAPTANTVLGEQANTYTPNANVTTLAPGEIGTTGGSQPHENRQPYLAVNFIVALQGVFPSQN